MGHFWGVHPMAATSSSQCVLAAGLTLCISCVFLAGDHTGIQLTLWDERKICANNLPWSSLNQFVIGPRSSQRRTDAILVLTQDPALQRHADDWPEAAIHHEE